eukprot:20703-Rhodomonas_salina.1
MPRYNAATLGSLPIRLAYALTRVPEQDLRKCCATEEIFRPWYPGYSAYANNLKTLTCLGSCAGTVINGVIMICLSRGGEQRFQSTDHAHRDGALCFRGFNFHGFPFSSTC